MIFFGTVENNLISVKAYFSNMKYILRHQRLNILTHTHEFLTFDIYIIVMQQLYSFRVHYVIETAERKGLLL